VNCTDCGNPIERCSCYGRPRMNEKPSPADKERPELEHPLRMLRNAAMRVGSFGNMDIEVVRRDEAEAILRDALRPAVVAALATPAPAAPMAGETPDEAWINALLHKPMDAWTGADGMRLAQMALRSSRSAGRTTAWLIENVAARWGTGYFWKGVHEFGSWGTVDEAVRFARKEDADRVIASLHADDKWRYGYRQKLKYEACEHEWPEACAGSASKTTE